MKLGRILGSGGLHLLLHVWHVMLHALACGGMLLDMRMPGSVVSMSTSDQQAHTYICTVQCMCAILSVHTNVMYVCVYVCFCSAWICVGDSSKVLKCVLFFRPALF